MGIKVGRIFLLGVLLSVGCTYNDIPPRFFDCSTTTLSVAVQSTLDPTACNAIDGSITVSASGGVSPYSFGINGASYQPAGSFLNLGPGTYTISVKDVNRCVRTMQVDISSPNSTLAVAASATPDNQCSTDNGSITLTPSGGKPPYTFQFGTGPVGTVNSFSSLQFGSYTIVVRDAESCPRIVNVLVPRGDTGTSFANDIKPILDTKCTFAGCHNGDNGASRNWTVFDNVKNNAANIKKRTADKTMPKDGTLTEEQINLIGCWVDDGAKSN